MTPQARELRLSRQGRATIALVAISMIGVIATAGPLFERQIEKYRAGGPFAPILYAGAILTFAAIFPPSMIQHKLGWQRRLLTTGTLGVGKVVRVIYFPRNRRIVEFQDAAGVSHRRRVRDLSRSFKVGMSVPVFYDAENPRDFLAACESLFKTERQG